MPARLIRRPDFDKTPVRRDEAWAVGGDMRDYQPRGDGVLRVAALRA